MIRLLTVTHANGLLFEEFYDQDEIPPYAILSHTWHIPNKEEVTFEDVEAGRGQHKAGWNKVEFCKARAYVDGLLYFWIDTCCINRKSEPELSEAINSMFRWYKQAARCYVYLSDVYMDHDWETQFRKSRWHTRGWTLQELIAPKRVDFFTRDGSLIGDRLTLETTICSVTSIHVDVLRGRPLTECTVEERLAWARTRTTKRAEDHVYSLFGLFDVTMPLVYGEGKLRAFERLYHEISQRGKRTQYHSTRLALSHVWSPCEMKLMKLKKKVTSANGWKANVADDDPANDLFTVLHELVLHHPTNLRMQTAMQRLREHVSTSITAESSGKRLQRLPKREFTHRSIYNPDRLPLTTAETEGDREEVGRLGLTTLLASLGSNLVALASVLTTPRGYFEALSSFYPEAYSLDDIGPEIICYSYEYERDNETNITVIQDLFVAKTQRHWIRVRLRLAVAVESSRWKLAIENKRQPTSQVRWRQLPQNLIALVENVMIESPDASDDTEVYVRYDSDYVAEHHANSTIVTGISQPPNLIFMEYKRKTTETLRHRNVRIIRDTDLVTTCVRHTCLLAHIDQRWVACRTTIASKSGFDLMCQGIEAGITLRGNPYIAPLVGVVLEFQTGLLKGFLVELPSKGPMFTLMADHRFKKKPIPWPRRQKWAKQIVCGIAAFHEKRQVVGALRTLCWTISINEHDDVMIMSGVHSAHPSSHARGGLLPPEYRTENFHNGNGQIEPEFDIFQLGSILWHLYRDQDEQGSKLFCTVAGCDNIYPDTCIEHKDPIALPPAAANVPQYLDRIIALCRQQRPSDRPAARELIDMFPSDEDILKRIDDLNDGENSIRRDDEPSTSRARLSRLEVVRALYSDNRLCNVCGNRCFEVDYVCETCNSGNYDLCQVCFSKSLHCEDLAHWLVKVDLTAYGNQKSSVQVIHFSSPNKKGEREQIVI